MVHTGLPGAPRGDVLSVQPAPTRRDECFTEATTSAPERESKLTAESSRSVTFMLGPGSGTHCAFWLADSPVSVLAAKEATSLCSYGVAINMGAAILFCGSLALLWISSHMDLSQLWSHDKWPASHVILSDHWICCTALHWLEQEFRIRSHAEQPLTKFWIHHGNCPNHLHSMITWDDTQKEQHTHILLSFRCSKGKTK